MTRGTHALMRITAALFTTAAFVGVAMPSAHAGTCDACQDAVQGLSADLAGPGLTPVPSSDPADYEPDAASVTAEAAKLRIVAQDDVALTEQLVTLADKPAPSEGSIQSPPPPDGGSTPPASAKVIITGKDQGQTEWCVPASVSTALTAFGVSSTVQGIANALGQGDSPNHAASSFGPAQRVLNNRQSRNYYVLTNPGSPHALLSYVQADVYHYGAASVGGFDTHSLPWWSGSTSQGGHALTMYAYYTADKGGFYVWDSAWVQRKNLKLPAAYTSMEAESSLAKVNLFLW